MIAVPRTLLAACLVAACTAPAASNEQGGGGQIDLPTGVTVEPSGFWSLATAPESPSGPPLRRGPQSELTYYAQLAGVSNEEAAKRLKEQEALRPEFERLMRTLRTKERGNYTDAELIHRPDWAFVLYFKRDPAATLAKYSKNLRFRARPAPYTEAELQTMTKPWIDRLMGERLVTGYAMNARAGRADVDMVVGEEEFAAIARRKGWGSRPDYVNLRFSGTPVGDAVEASLAEGLRIFPQSDRNLGIINQALLSGRIVLEDGCFKVIGFDGSEKLAYFAREIGLRRDRQGYMSLYRRSAEGTHLGRIGEMFSWAGPIGIGEDAPMVRELRAQCGNAPLMHVGVPESSAIFNARYGLPRQPPRRPGAVPDAPPAPPAPPQPPPPPPRRD